MMPLRPGSVIVGALGAAVLLGALVLLILGITSVQSPAPPIGPEPVSEPENAVSSSEADHGVTTRRCAAASQPLLVIEVSTLNPQTERMTLTLYLCASTRALESMIESPGHPLFDVRQTPEGPKIIPRSPQAVVRMSVLRGAGETENFAPVSLSRFSEVAAHIQLGTFEELMSGSPPLYPFDSYNASFGCEVTTFDPNNRITSHLFVKPLFIDGPAMQPLHTEGEALEGNPLLAGMHIHRPVAAIIYIVLVAMVPMILALLMIIVVLARSSKEQFSFGAAELAGIGAVLLAILPVRQVLVPPSATQLTLVDYILGLEMAVMIGFACFAVSFILARHPTPDPT
jgi:Domain of unknown function (DUF4436)